MNFKSGQATKLQKEADLVFRYGVPEDTSGMRYNPFTGVEFRVGIKITQNYPVLAAAKTASFKSVAETKDLTLGRVNTWTEDEYGVAPGRVLVVRAITTGEHYLVRIVKLTGELAAPKTWRMTLSYRPLALRRADAAGVAAPSDLGGTLTFREQFGTNLILDVDVASGRVTRRFDGFSPSRSLAGEYAYVDGADRIVIASPQGKETLAIPAPPAGADDIHYGRGGAHGAVLSPDGKAVAVLVDRGLGHVVVIDRKGRELADFASRTHPAWTPDGRLVMAKFGLPGLTISDEKLRSEREIPAAANWRVTDIAVSPDDRRLALTMNGRVWTCGLDGADLKPVAATGLAQSSPAWSPDGAYIALRTEIPHSVVASSRIEIVRLKDGKSFTLLDTAGGFHDVAGRLTWR